MRSHNPQPRETHYYRLVRYLPSLVFLLAAFTANSRAQSLAITHANVIDTVTGNIQPDTTIVVQGNRIVSIAASATAPKPEGQVIDATGQFLIPGLWDMHTHVYFGGTAGDGTDLILPTFVAEGITGIRDMGSDLDPVLHAREEIAAHRLLGPRMVVSGPMLDGPKSHWAAALSIVTPDDGRKAVDMLKGRGVDFIKVQSGVPREAYFAIAEQAKKDGIEFEGHVPNAIRASEAVNAGQRTFEHLIGIFEASSPDETKYLTGKKSPGRFLDTYDRAREAVIVKLLAQNHVWQCPTLFWERGQWLVDILDYNNDPDIAFAGKTWVTKQWPAAQKSILKSMDTDPRLVREEFFVHELDIVRRLHEANVPFLAGTDTPAGVDVIPGVSLHRELERFVAAGFTPLEALQTATLNPAEFYHRQKDFGTVHAGALADLVLLEANPVNDIPNTRKIAGVIADGRYLSKPELEKLRSDLKQLAATK